MSDRCFDDRNSADTGTVLVDYQPQPFRMRYGYGMKWSVAQYAEEAGISVRRVRQLAEIGKIDAEKVGSSWIIQGPILVQPRGAHEGGRPLSEQSAWETALMLDGYAISAHRPARVRERIERLRNDPKLRNSLNAWLSARAQVKHFKVQPADLKDVRSDRRLHATGVSHPESGLLQAQEYEAYVLRSDFSPVVEEYMLMPSHSRQANVTLRVINLPKFPRAVPRLLIAADLIDRQGPRELSAAREILDNVL